jgi:heme exporter protein CcmD
MMGFVVAAYVITFAVIGGYAFSIYWRRRQVETELRSGEDNE